MEDLQDVYCKVAAKSMDNPFKPGSVYKYSKDLNLVYDADGIPHTLGTFENHGPLEAHVDYFDANSPVLAMFVEA